MRFPYDLPGGPHFIFLFLCDCFLLYSPLVGLLFPLYHKTMPTKNNLLVGVALGAKHKCSQTILCYPPASPNSESLEFTSVEQSIDCVLPYSQNIHNLLRS